MKVSLLLPLAVSAVLTTAFTIPDEHTISQLVLEDDRDHHDRLQEPISHHLGDDHDRDHGHGHAEDHDGEPHQGGHRSGRGNCNRDPIHKGWLIRDSPPPALGTHIDLSKQEAFNVLQWGRSGRHDQEVLDEREAEIWFEQHYRPTFRHGKKRPEGRPIQRPPPRRTDPDAEDWVGTFPAFDDDEPGKRPPPHGPPKWHIPHPPSKTIYEIISSSNYTTNFTSILSDFPNLVKILNSTSLPTDTKYTLFVPTDKAFERFKDVPKDKKPPKEFIEKWLAYHISHDFYPSFRLLLGHTIPSSLDADDTLGGPQRLRVGLGPHGLTVNFYSTILAANIFATNGVIHAVDNLLFPPPNAGRIISLLPTEFSTLILGLHLTNLTSELHGLPHVGGTFFAPSNNAFKALGPRVNAFLFSPWGRKYLKALLLYHIVVNDTLYSDAYYHPTIEVGTLGVERATDIPKGKYHVDLPTLLKGKHLSIDISRFGAFITIVINGQASVKIQDGIARDGVIQVPDRVLVPPKAPPRKDSEKDEWDGEQVVEAGGRDISYLTVEGFKARFKGLVDEAEDAELGIYKEEDVIAMWE